MTDPNERRMPTDDELIAEARAEATQYSQRANAAAWLAGTEQAVFEVGWIRGVKRGIELERERNKTGNG